MARLLAAILSMYSAYLLQGVGLKTCFLVGVILFRPKSADDVCEVRHCAGRHDASALRADPPALRSVASPQRRPEVSTWHNKRCNGLPKYGTGAKARSETQMNVTANADGHFAACNEPSFLAPSLGRVFGGEARRSRRNLSACTQRNLNTFRHSD